MGVAAFVAKDDNLDTVPVRNIGICCQRSHHAAWKHDLVSVAGIAGYITIRVKRKLIIVRSNNGNFIDVNDFLFMCEG